MHSLGTQPHIDHPQLNIIETNLACSSVALHVCVTANRVSLIRCSGLYGYFDSGLAEIPVEMTLYARGLSTPPGGFFPSDATSLFTMAFYFVHNIPSLPRASTCLSHGGLHIGLFLRVAISLLILSTAERFKKRYTRTRSKY